MKILVVDDDPVITESVKLVLEDEGHDVLVESKGEAVSNTVAQTSPDLVLLDVWLPDILGGEVAKKLKKDHQTCNVPVVLVSASHNLPKLMGHSGADGYLSKPFQVSDLLQKIDHLTHRRRTKKLLFLDHVTKSADRVN